jgi:hypothetical protein
VLLLLPVKVRKTKTKQNTLAEAEFFQRKNTEPGTQPESVGTAVVMYIHKARCALYLLNLRSV